jgi:PUB domain
MAVKAGGAFRLVKVNSDNERPVSGALEVTALPTVFGVRDGRIVNMFQGMPRSEDMMKNFMMGLFGVAPFKPAVTDEEATKYKAWTSKLVKTAGAACFSFSARESLAERINAKLDDLVNDDSAPDVEAAAILLRTLMNNVVKDPFEPKYRTINLENKMIASKLGNNANALGVLKSVGFAKSGSAMALGQGKKVINVAPLVVARDCIDKWIQKNRNEMAAAARRRQDEADRVNVQAKLATKMAEEDSVEEEEETIDPTVCHLKLRVDGKKKVHEVSFKENDPLSAILAALSIEPSTENEVQITCVAKRLVVSSSEDTQMQKSLKEHGLMPAASVVVKVAASGQKATPATSSLKERAAGMKKKTGSHTMQSIGIYAKDDNNKAELIDGGGGVWYEHDVSDDEGEGSPEQELDELPGNKESMESKDDTDESTESS